MDVIDIDSFPFFQPIFFSKKKKGKKKWLHSFSAAVFFDLLLQTRRRNSHALTAISSIKSQRWNDRWITSPYFWPLSFLTWSLEHASWSLAETHVTRMVQMVAGTTGVTLYALHPPSFCRVPSPQREKKIVLFLIHLSPHKKICMHARTRTKARARAHTHTKRNTQEHRRTHVYTDAHMLTLSSRSAPPTIFKHNLS